MYNAMAECSIPFQVTVTLTSDLVSRIIMSEVTLTLTLTSSFLCLEHTVVSPILHITVLKCNLS